MVKNRKALLVCACFVGLSQTGWSQASDANSQGIVGYLNPATGTLKPVANVPRTEDEIQPLVSPTAGDFKVTYHITVKSAIASTATVLCTFDASVVDIGSGLTMDDSMSVVATGSGASRTCTLDMFYSWPLSSATSDTVALSYSISTGGASAAALTRVSTQTLPSKKPAPSGTTTLTITATI